MGAACGKYHFPLDPAAEQSVHPRCCLQAACPSAQTSEACGSTDVAVGLAVKHGHGPRGLPRQAVGRHVCAAGDIRAAGIPVLEKANHQKLQPNTKKQLHKAQDGRKRVRSYVADISGLFDIEEEVLGQGSYGVVRRCTRKATGAAFAVKFLPRRCGTVADHVRQEVAMLKVMDHPNIVRLFEACEDRFHHCLVMELCAGGELFQLLCSEGRLCEADSAKVMRQVLQATNYVHGKHIAHRDLKPENFMFLSKGPVEGNSLKLIDFGFACPCAPGKILRTKIGTAIYMAPQVVMGKYDRQCDVWSAGCILYALLCGEQAFGGMTEKELVQCQREGKWSFSSVVWKVVSEDAKELIRNMLCLQPSERYTAAQALEHRWLCGQDLAEGATCIVDLRT